MKNSISAPQALTLVRDATAMSDELITGRISTGCRCGALKVVGRVAILMVDGLQSLPDCEKTVAMWEIPPVLFWARHTRLNLANDLLSAGLYADDPQIDHDGMPVVDVDVQGVLFELDALQSWFGLTEDGSEKLPPVSPAKLRTWYESLVARVGSGSLTQDEVIQLASSKFSDNFISRDSVRELRGPQKRGPKPQKT